MKLRNYEGTITIDHQKELLELSVIPRDKNIANSVSSANCLSGGERSYSTVAFLLALWSAVDSPFYFLDEYDVYTVSGCDPSEGNFVSRSIFVSLGCHQSSLHDGIAATRGQKEAASTIRFLDTAGHVGCCGYRRTQHSKVSCDTVLVFINLPNKINVGFQIGWSGPEMNEGSPVIRITIAFFCQFLIIFLLNKRQILSILSSFFLCECSARTFWRQVLDHFAIWIIDGVTIL